MTTMAAPAAAVKAPAATAAAGSQPSESRIDKDSHFNGLYETKQNLRIEGLAEGEIQCEGTLTVAEGARVKAKVTASTITIAGELDGEVLCHGVFQIMPSGQVSASVSARRLIVQEGGLYNGDFRMITDAAPAPRTDSASSARPSNLDEGAGETIASDDWWKKFTAGETSAGDKPADDKPDGGATDRDVSSKKGGKGG